MRKKRKAKRKVKGRKTKFQKSLATTLKLRSKVKKKFRPLFDHIINLSAHSHTVGYPQRAGIELKQARKIAKY